LFTWGFIVLMFFLWRVGIIIISFIILGAVHNAMDGFLSSIKLVYAAGPTHVNASHPRSIDITHPRSSVRSALGQVLKSVGPNRISVPQWRINVVAPKHITRGIISAGGFPKERRLITAKMRVLDHGTSPHDPGPITLLENKI